MSIEPLAGVTKLAVRTFFNLLIKGTVVAAIREIDIARNDPARILQQRRHIAGERARIPARLSSHVAVVMSPSSCRHR